MPSFYFVLTENAKKIIFTPLKKEAQKITLMNIHKTKKRCTEKCKNTCKTN